MKTVYKADDGTEFENQDECVRYEAGYAKKEKLQEHVTNAMWDDDMGPWELAQGIADCYDKIKAIMEG